MDFYQICEEMRKRIEKYYQSSSDAIVLGARGVLFDAFGEVKRARGNLENKKTLSLSKLADVLALISQPENIQKKFIRQKSYIESNEETEKARIEQILATASILKMFGHYVVDMSSDDLWDFVGNIIQTEIVDYDANKERVRRILAHYLLKCGYVKNDEQEETEKTI